MQQAKAKRTVLGMVLYVLVVCVSYGVARAIAALTGWTEPWALVTLSLAAFVLLIVLLANLWGRFRSES